LAATADLTQETANGANKPQRMRGLEAHGVDEDGAVFRRCEQVSNLSAHGPEGIWDRESAVQLELGDFEGLLAWGGKRAGLPVARVDTDRAVGDLTVAQMAGTDLKTISDQLGHSSIVLTADTYTSVLPAAQYKAAEATARLVLDAARHERNKIATVARRMRVTVAKARR